MESEQVLVVPTQLFHELGHFQGFHRDVSRYLDVLLDSDNTSYHARREMEADPSFKQLIPYVVFEWTSPEGEVHLFQYTRGGGQGESRLHAKRSIGVGGHISLEDESNEHSDPYREGMLREIEEEVALTSQYRERCVGLINDDQTEVGQVHMGVVHVFQLDAPHVEPRETEILDAGFWTVAQLHQAKQQLETWSQICLDALYPQDVPE